MDADFSKIVGGLKGATPVETKSFPALGVKSIDFDKRQITALASTAALDRQGDVVEPEAFREPLPRYMENPVVLAAHKHTLMTGSSPVVANVIKAWIDKKGLWIIVEFVKGTALGEEYWQLYSQKKQRAFSIGFQVLDSRDDHSGGKRITVITRLELIEISCVPVPANPEALSKSNQRKASFVQSKRQESEDEKLLAELRKEFPDIDKLCEEYGDALVGDDSVGCHSTKEEDYEGYSDDDEQVIDTKEVDFAALVAPDHKRVVRGEDRFSKIIDTDTR